MNENLDNIKFIIIKIIDKVKMLISEIEDELEKESYGTFEDRADE